MIEKQERDIFVICMFNRSMMLMLQFSAVHILSYGNTK